MAKCEDHNNSQFAVRNGIFCKLINDYHASNAPVNAADFKKLLLLEVHASALGGHLRLFKMRKLIEKRFYWKSLQQDIIKFLKECQVCQ